ncbi:pimeloyl-ACP methyl ester carboxylesterase [Bradyrhizobium sp. JR4.1]|uniref:hypothetical protein n=1 Tax=Bradyrhizobium sp. JR4.1 TaxID=3156372 RepID=UPI003390DFBF
MLRGKIIKELGARCEICGVAGRRIDVASPLALGMRYSKPKLANSDLAGRSMEPSNATIAAEGKTKTVVVLIHGIRTQAWWQKSVAPIIEKKTGATVIPLKYGYFDLVRFWCPFGLCRNPPIERLRKQIEGIREQFKDYRLVVFAHSYGTYALSRILLENPYFTFHRIILCGSIVPEDFDWRRVDNQILSANKRDGIINECGLKDVWPVIARSISWGYGASGTYGFGSFNVRDRFHAITHSAFFEPSFVNKYWVSAVAGEAIEFSPTDRSRETSPARFALFRIPLRWFLTGVVALVVVGVPIAAILAILQSNFLALQQKGPQTISTTGSQSPIVKDSHGDVRIDYNSSAERRK